MANNKNDDIGNTQKKTNIYFFYEFGIRDDYMEKLKYWIREKTGFNNGKSLF